MEWFIKILAEFFHWDTSVEPLPATTLPMTPQAPPRPASPDPDSYILPWTSRSNNYHNVRVLCDKAGLTVAEKNLICACLYQESMFSNQAVNKNKNAAGVVMSADWGICQTNDYYHIGQNKDFPSVQYVLDNPDKVVAWMINMYKHGMLKQWVSYSSGAYKQWLVPTSPMWGLGGTL